TTTTSSRLSFASSNVMSTSLDSGIVASLVPNPTVEKTRTPPPEGASIWKAPASSVVVTDSVPFNDTVTPGNNCPSTPLTVPVTLLVCAASSRLVSSMPLSNITSNKTTLIAQLIYYLIIGNYVEHINKYNRYFLTVPNNS